MDIDKILDGLDSYFENTPKEHFEKIWNDVRKYEAYGPDVDEFLRADESERQGNVVGDAPQIHHGKFYPSATYTFAGIK